MTQKSLLQSAGDGTTVPAGYIGEVQAVNSGPLTGLPANPISFSAPITLKSGVYLIILTGNQEAVPPGFTELLLTDGGSNVVYTDSFGTIAGVQILNNQPAGSTVKSMCIMRVIVDGAQFKARLRTECTSGAQHILGIQAIRLA